jgi:hypothetical protein
VERDLSSDEHLLQLTTWDVPPTVLAGERFRFSVGVKCPVGCNLAGRELAVLDQEGSGAGTAKLGHDVWPGTEALYFAVLEAGAPLTAGSHQWEARIVCGDAGAPHAAGSCSLAVRVVSAPDCEVTIRAVDREKQTPIKGARVIMHPYRAVADENGIAKVRVAKGQYQLLVSGLKYLPASISVEVTADMTTSAELDADRPWRSPDEALE